MSQERLPLFYTFGNHQHWIDMQWLWGYHVLPGAVRDMLKFMAETGAKANVNFDGVGYEKMAAECPEELGLLREAVQKGDMEIVGASYAQPYGLFHGWESNVRHRIYGVRAVMRTLGVRPRTFWEEEFDFFPQLPQILCSAGYEYASLFFQWTWHTPDVPTEEVPAVRWTGIDGSSIVAATRNKLNLHQWPEDFDGLLDSPAVREMPAAGLVQWLELMPSPDWMCRSEVMLPRMKELMADPRFDVKCGTLSEYLDYVKASGTEIPARSYTLDDVWHGLTLGAYGDRNRRECQLAEEDLLAAEVLSCQRSYFGRPYINWDVYPTWELEEGWRNLLIAQHHDNDECEGLCGHVAKPYLRSAEHLAANQIEKVREVDGGTPRVANFSDQPCDVATEAGVFKSVPPFGFVPLEGATEPAFAEWDVQGATARLEHGDAVWQVQGETGELALFSGGTILGKARFGLSGPINFEADGEVLRLETDDACIELSLRWDGALSVIQTHAPEQLEPGLNAGVWLEFDYTVDEIVADYPWGWYRPEAQNTRVRKYPTGDWMTSPQWFEEAKDLFTSQSYVDLVRHDGHCLLIAHEQHEQWQRSATGVRCLVLTNDPWHGPYEPYAATSEFALIPHRGMRPSERLRKARLRPGAEPVLVPEHAPERFTGPFVHDAGVVVSAWYRETTDQGRHLPAYGAAKEGTTEYPFVIRMVEYDGRETQTVLDVPGTVAWAWKTNLLGEAVEKLPVEVADGRSRIEMSLRAHEIATVYLDVAEARKQNRDLDARRKVWATVHKRGSGD